MPEPLPHVRLLCQPRILVWAQRRHPSSRLWVSPQRSPGVPLKSWWVIVWLYCIFEMCYCFSAIIKFSFFLISRVTLAWSRPVTRLVPERQHSSTCWTSRPSREVWSSSRCMTMAVFTALRCLTSQRQPCTPASWRWDFSSPYLVLSSAIVSIK